MNGGMLLKMSFFDKILSIFDIIPKLIYFLSAVFLSAIDALQCLVRKLAGLDVYYVKGVDSTDLSPVAQQDPLSEFIYGILGIGDSAPLYKALNTVFWSLAIFAVICLAVTSIIAIIKSHYNEDVSGTSPWKYIYTAIKAIFTFAIVPLAVIIGIELASWTLRTVDSITAGSATEDTLASMYGQGANAFESGYLNGQNESNGGTKYYSNYDLFGAGSPTSSTPFSGMLFKACAYDANRARTDTGVANAIKTIKTNAGIEVFKEGADAAEIADMVDYAFANNLRLSDGNMINRGEISDTLTEAGVAYWSATDLFSPLVNTKGFSKYNVGLVWMFYNLWSYNFIVAFGGGVTIMGIMLSVIIGLMSRLMKGAALFLVYPALLGIAPLDNFKAFKSWTTQFMQQVLMAFGAIIGMNLTLLILPYVQNIRFFNLAVVDNIVNIVLVMTGLMMMKDIISMVSNFVGGADANTSGSTLKGEVGKAIGSGAKVAGVAAVATGRTVAGGAAAVGRRAVRIARGGKQGEMRRAQNKVKDAKTAKGNATNAVYGVLGNSNNAGMANAVQAAEAAALAEKRKGLSGKKAKNVKLTDEERNKVAAEARNKYYDEHREEFLTDDNVAVRAAAKADVNADIALNEAKDKRKKVAGRYGFSTDADGEIVVENTKTKRNGTVVERYKEKDKEEKKLKDGYRMETIETPDGKKKKVYYDAEGNQVSAKDAQKQGVVGGMLKGVGKWFDEQTMGEAGKHLADGFLKGIGSLSSAAGLDKMMKGMGEIFTNGMTFKGGVFDVKDPKPEGDKLAAQHHEEQRALAEKNARDAANQNKELLKALEKLTNATTSGLSGLSNKFTVVSNKLDKLKP